MNPNLRGQSMGLHSLNRQVLERNALCNNLDECFADHCPHHYSPGLHEDFEVESKVGSGGKRPDSRGACRHNNGTTIGAGMNDAGHKNQ